MSVYGRFVFPLLVEFAMSGDTFARLRTRLLDGVSGQVLEVGFGTGLNARHYPAGLTVTCGDPHAGMAKRAQRRVQAASADFRLIRFDGAALPFPDRTFDTVVTTWTLCSVECVRDALAEIRRVLRPEGRYVFVEHGASPDAGVRRWQDRLTPLQRRIAGGCRLNRNIETMVRDAGFDDIVIERFYLEGIPRIGAFTYVGSATTVGLGSYSGGRGRPPEAMIR